MDGDTAQRIVVAVTGTLAVALSAATLSSTVSSSGSDGPGVAGSGSGSGTGGPGVGLVGELGSGGGVFPVIPYFREVVLALLFVTLVAVLWYAIRNWRDTLRFVAAVAVLVVASIAFLTLLPPWLLGGSQPVVEVVIPPASGGGGGDAGATTPVPPLLVVLVLAGVGLFAGAVVATRRRSESTTAEPEPDEPADDSTDAEVIAQAAGRAADRIESADSAAAVDNEIYRAWREMTTRVDVTDPETTTPGEFADVAVGAGLAREDVRELTTLFEEVRYGSHEPTDEDERRSAALLRRIEGERTADSGGDE
ncbi:DUF4129 domain-containing protein [Halosimplex sp. TS25]|uniref:DUF4129 domain-containing protein n=1 Tax=Halosimplex rarum TaxID=3396619 RepID=UPI0039E8D3BE